MTYYDTIDYIHEIYIMKLDEQITPGYSLSYPQREDRPARADLKKLQRLTETNQVPPLGGYHGGRKSHDFLIFGDFGKISHGFFLRFSWFPGCFFVFSKCGKEIHVFFQDFPSTKQNPA